MKKDKVMEYLFAIILCCVLFFNLFVLNVFNDKYIFAIFLLIYLLICKIYVKDRKAESVNKNKVILLMSVFSIIYILLLYVVGISAGFYKNPTPFSCKGLVTRILPYTAILICAELIRNIFVTRNNKKSTIIVTVALVTIDILTNIELYNNNNLRQVLALIGYVGLSSISVNLLCNYIVKRYGYIPNMIYRVITTIYIYVFSIIPDIYLFFQSVFRIIYPYIIYILIDTAFATNNFKMVIKNKKANIVSIIGTTIICISIVLLVSCKFKYGIMVVGSSSMADSINKGDLILFEQYSNQELDEGQVIIFNKDNKMNIHRIIDVRILNDETIYYTKGDNNQQQDEGYRKSQDISGVVKLNINYLGWPTIWINKLFEN